MGVKIKTVVDLCHFALWSVILIALAVEEFSANQTDLVVNTKPKGELDPDLAYFNDFDSYGDDSFSRKTRGLYEHDDYYYPIHPPPPPPKKGYYVPVSEYYVKHHKPGKKGFDEWSKKKPEVWEYKGTYFYKKKKKKHYHPPPPPFPPPFLPAAMIAAGLPLIMMPLLTMLMTMPVLVPVNNGGTTIDDGTGFINNVNGGGGTVITNAGLTNGLFNNGFNGGLNNGGFITNGRRRRAAAREHPDIQRTLQMREMQLVGDYLRQVSYDTTQQHRLLVNYLQCQGMLSPEEHCMERLACGFSRRKPQQRKKSEELEKTVTSILLGHILHNEFVPRSFKRRMKTAAKFGRNSENSCIERYYCATIDGARGNESDSGSLTNINKINRKQLTGAKERSQINLLKPS